MCKDPAAGEAGGRAAKHRHKEKQASVAGRLAELAVQSLRTWTSS